MCSIRHLSVQLFLDCLGIVKLNNEVAMVLDEIEFVLKDVKVLMRAKLFVQCFVRHYSRKCNLLAG